MKREEEMEEKWVGGLIRSDTEDVEKKRRVEDEAGREGWRRKRGTRWGWMWRREELKGKSIRKK